MIKSINADICYPFKQLHGSSPFVIYLTPLLPAPPRLREDLHVTPCSLLPTFTQRLSLRAHVSALLLNLSLGYIPASFPQRIAIPQSPLP